VRPTTGRIRAKDGQIIALIHCPADIVHDLPNALRRYANDIEAGLITEGFEMDPPMRGGE
jgi:hypothetical protein